MFILACEKEESLWNLMSEMSKNRDDAKKKQVSKDCMNYLQWVVINSNFSYFLLVSLLVGSQFL